MSITLKSNRDDILDYVSRTWKRGANHLSYVNWRSECIQWRKMYDGSLGQWNPADLEALKQNNEIPITVNVIAGFVDSLCGTENQIRYKNIAKIDEHTQQARDISRGLTQFLLNWQEYAKINHIDSIKFKNCLVSGIAWSSVYFENGAIKYDLPDSMEIIFDANDLSDQLTNSEFLGRMHFMLPGEINLKWKDKVGKLDLEDYEADTDYLCGELANMSSINVSDATYNNVGRKRLVRELQYKVPALAYQGMAKNGRWYTTFDIEAAEKVSASKNDIEEYQSNRILRTLCFQDIVLNHAFLNPSYPDQEEFSHIPIIWKRRSGDFIPQSFIDPMQGLQMYLNACFTKSTNTLNANKVFIIGELGKLSQKSPEQIKKHIFQKNSVTVLPKETQVKFETGIVLSDESIKFVMNTIEMMKRVCGIYDDMRGGNSSNTSGIAEQIRIKNSLRNNAFIFERFADMKKRVCTQAIKLLQATANDNYYIPAYNKEYPAITLNYVQDRLNGKTEILNDINFLPFTLYLQEVPNFSSSLDQKKEELLAVLNNPHANILLMTPEFLDLFMDNGKEVAEGFAKSQNMLSQMQANAKKPPPDQQPSSQGTIPTVESLMGE